MKHRHIPSAYLSRQELSGLMEGFLIDRLDPAQDSFARLDFHPRLAWNRFDLAIKLYYAQTLGPDQPAFARALYDAHIHAFSLGDMSEPGNSNKTHLGQFHADFAEMLREFHERGFDRDKSIVPLASDGSILNGAHRSACAMAQGIPLTGVMTGLEPFTFDYLYFRSRGMSDHFLDAAAVKYVELSPQSRVALIWPSTPKPDDRLRRILGPLVYCREIFLNHMGAFNALAQIYEKEPWLGSPDKGLPGIRVKQMGCFASQRSLRVMVFDHDGSRDLVAVKEQIRALFDLGKHSIHMADTHEETVMIARLMLNEHSVSFLNQARPFGGCGGFHHKQAFHDYLHRHAASPDSLLISDDFVMSAYGLRPAQRIGFLSNLDLPDEKDIARDDAGCYPIPLRDMLADPDCHFHYWDLKFITPRLLARMKAARNTATDATDLRLLAPLLHQSWFGKLRLHLGCQRRIALSRLRRRLIRFLDWLGLKRWVRRLYMTIGRS